MAKSTKLTDEDIVEGIDELFKINSETDIQTCLFTMEADTICSKYGSTASEIRYWLEANKCKRTLGAVITRLINLVNLRIIRSVAGADGIQRYASVSLLSYYTDDSDNGYEPSFAIDGRDTEDFEDDEDDIRYPH